MPKRGREPDDASQDLIDDIRDQDERDGVETYHNNELATIHKLYDDSMRELYKEFNTKDQSTLSERDQIRMKTKVEYQETLRDDRVRHLESEKQKRLSDICVKIGARSKRRRIDKTLNECSVLASQSAKEIDWKDIGKQKHLQKSLKILNDKMSEEQHEKYQVLLEDLKKNGHKILNK